MKVGVIGAGTMGSGIAQAFAQTEGYEVVLCDINEAFAEKGKEKIAKGLQKKVARGKLSEEEAEAIIGKITTGLRDKCADCDLIVEAAFEDMASMRCSKNLIHSANQKQSSLQIHHHFLSQKSVPV
jgi:3-hydroxybutyryl-CoA dehydrogenase